MSYFECPYCEEELEEPDLDGCKPMEIYEDECPHCERKFGFTIEYSVEYSTHKAECLNGGTHDWNDILSYNKHMEEYYSVYRECKGCGKEEHIPRVREAREVKG